MVNLKQYYSSKFIFVILGLFSAFLLIIGSCFGIFTWIRNDVLRNIELGQKNGFVYYELIDFDSDFKELTQKIFNEVEKSFEKYIEDLEKAELLSDFSIDLLNDFSLNVYLTFSQKEFFVFLIDAIEYKSRDNKSMNDNKILNLLKSGNMMLKLDKDKLIVIFPVLNGILQNSNVANYHRLENLINTMNSNNVIKNKEDYLKADGDFYVRFMFSTDGLKFKLDSFDFNDSFIIKSLIGDDVNTVLNNDDKNMIYKNFFDFSSWGGTFRSFQVKLKLSNINIQDGYFKTTLSFNFNLD